MKYSQPLVMQAVCEFVPVFAVHRSTMPEMLRDAAVQAFLECETVDYKFSSNKNYAALIIKNCLTELGQVGFIKYGTMTHYWGCGEECQ